MIEFEWNQAKASLKKHGVSFEGAQSVFYDDLALQFFDETLGAKTRFILLGRSNLSRVLLVVHCERGEHDEILRIISARKATKTEQNFYMGDQI